MFRLVTIYEGIERFLLLYGFTIQSVRIHIDDDMPRFMLTLFLVPKLISHRSQRNTQIACGVVRTMIDAEIVQMDETMNSVASK